MNLLEISPLKWHLIIYVEYPQHKTCKNTEFHWPIFSRIRTKSSILSLYGRIQSVKTRILAYFMQRSFKNAQSIYELCSSFYTHAEPHCLGNHNNLALESQADTEKLTVKEVIWKFQKGMQCCLKSRQYSWKVSAKGSIFSKSQNFHFWIRIWKHLFLGPQFDSFFFETV